MKQVKVEVIIDTRDADQISALNNLLTVIGKSTEPSETVTNESEDADPSPAPVPAKRTRTKKEKPVQEEPAQEEPENIPGLEESEKEKPTEEPAEEKKEYTVEEVRQILKDKVSDHREKIKEKLSSLNAPNVSSLSPEKYGEFVEFLNSLN